MTRQRPIPCACLLCTLALAWAVATAGETPNTASRIAELRTKVLADPGDKKSVGELMNLRIQQRKQREEGRTAAVKGLSAYLDGDFMGAAEQLRKVAAAPGVLAAANSLLLSPIDEIIADCTRRSSASGRAANLCPVCGGTGWADCPADTCYGTGTVVCPHCRGMGRGRHKTRGIVECPKCRGTGYRRCPKCYGSGLVRCPKCGGAVNPEQVWVGSNAAAAIEKALTRLAYLRDGGVDLFSRDALEPSPRLNKTSSE